MNVTRAIPPLRRVIQGWKRKGETVGFVPTMGNLHAGHAALLRRAARECDRVGLSIYVNPLQFGPREDFASYPRTARDDLALARAAGVDLVFMPDEGLLYPPGYGTFVTEEIVSRAACGRFRPGHFRGVATVVAKLFHLVSPDRAYFGAKDGQQLRLIEKMVEDLNFPVRIVPVPTVRTREGLALSSRNRRLSPEDRRSALVLSRALRAVRASFDRGERSVARLIRAVRPILAAEPRFRLQYLEILRRSDFSPVRRVTEPAVACLAGFIGGGRLIDNVALDRRRA